MKDTHICLKQREGELIFWMKYSFKEFYGQWLTVRLF